jgi:hypothetical protein
MSGRIKKKSIIQIFNLNYYYFLLKSKTGHEFDDKAFSLDFLEIRYNIYVYLQVKQSCTLYLILLYT